MADFLFSVVAFFVIYFCYLLFVILRPKKLEKFKEASYILFLVHRYNVDLKKTNIKTLAHVVALTNSFVISITLYIISFTNNIILMLLLSILVIIPFLLIMYHLIGKLFGNKK